jgi:hypothetical protein
MDAKDAVQVLVESAQAAVSRRRRALAETDAAVLTLGATANLLRDRYGQSQAATAEVIGVPAATVSVWMAKAASAGYTVDDPLQRTRVLGVEGVDRYVDGQPMNIDRVVVGRGEAQVLAMTGLSLDDFIGSAVPLLAFHDATSGDWVGVSGVLPGRYGGTGPSNVYRVVTALGVDPEVAKRMAYIDECSDLDVLADELSVGAADTSPFPHPLPTQHRDMPGQYVWAVGAAEFSAWARGGRAETGTSAYPMYLNAWFQALTHRDPPDWMNGTLKARVYLRWDKAAEDGFCRPGFGGADAVSQLVIERGRTQLWVSLYKPLDPERWIADEVYDTLDALGLFPADIHAEDTQTKLRRWIRNRIGLGMPRPDYVDIDAIGANRGLSFIPAATGSAT